MSIEIIRPILPTGEVLEAIRKQVFDTQQNSAGQAIILEQLLEAIQEITRR